MQITTRRRLNINNLACASGASSVIRILLSIICKPGDGVMIPTPCYGSFVRYITDFSSCKFIPIESFSRNDFKLSFKDMEETYLNNATKELPITTIIITNPNNPTGRLINKDLYIDYFKFAKKYNLNIVVDEIYSNSIISNTFISSLDLIDDHFNNEEKEYLNKHTFIVNGPSKDFGMSGFRVGFLYTENSVVFLQFMTHIDMASNFTQRALSFLFEDAWTREYVVEYQSELKRYYNRAIVFLETNKIPYLKADSGIFICVDLRKYMKELTFDEEMRLGYHIMNNHFLYINYGKSFYFSEPGFFRIVYTDKHNFDRIFIRLKAALDSFN